MNKINIIKYRQPTNLTTDGIGTHDKKTILHMFRLKNLQKNQGISIQKNTCDIISSPGSIKESANETFAGLSTPNVTSLFCSLLKASIASEREENSKNANPRFVPLSLESSTKVISSTFVTP